MSRRTTRARRWIRRAFFAWAILSTSFLLNTFRTRGVPATMLESDARVSVREDRGTLELLPFAATNVSRLVFLCGAGVSAEAYVPLLRPIAEAGHPVTIVRLPWRLAPLETHKRAAMRRAVEIGEREAGVHGWVLAGHSLGAALASRIAAAAPRGLRAVVLLGTTHPKSFDLSRLKLPVTKVYATQDGVAPREKIEANRHLLPRDTRWVVIEGGNHSQFGHYGHQLFDGLATISREQQQALTRAALLAALEASKGTGAP